MQSFTSVFRFGCFLHSHVLLTISTPVRIRTVCIFISCAFVLCKQMHYSQVTHSHTQPEYFNWLRRCSQWIWIWIYFGDFRVLFLFARFQSVGVGVCVNKILTNHYCDLEIYMLLTSLSCVVDTGNIIPINQMCIWNALDSNDLCTIHSINRVRILNVVTMKYRVK